MSTFSDKVFPAIVIVVAVVGFLFVAYKLVMNEPIFGFSQNTVSASTAPFDHSDCQYPNRLSNPVDGCDNTDPARPECMKFGTEDCTIVNSEPESPPAASGEVKTPSCSEN